MKLLHKGITNLLKYKRANLDWNQIVIDVNHQTYFDTFSNSYQLFRPIRPRVSVIINCPQKDLFHNAWPLVVWELGMVMWHWGKIKVCMYVCMCVLLKCLKLYNFLVWQIECLLNSIGMILLSSTVRHLLSRSF